MIPGRPSRTHGDSAKRHRRLILVFFALLCLASGCAETHTPPNSTPNTRHTPQQREILVSAASSLTDAFTEIGAAFTKAHPEITVRFNFAASGAILRQAEAGAPMDVFASASPIEIKKLDDQGRLAPGTQTNFAGNRLALITPPASSRIQNWDDLPRPFVRRVAVSDPDAVPSGRYARETLTRRGLWTAVEKKAVFGENVRQTLAYVTNGDADAGIVFASDAVIAGKRVRVAATAAPGKDHAPIVYPAAALRDAPHPDDAAAFVLFLREPEAQAILSRYGFTPPPLNQTP